MIQLPPDLAEVLKVIQSNEDGKAIVFPDANEDLIGDLALAWEKWNTFAETRVGAIVANAKLAMEAMEGEAAESFAGYLRKFCEGDGSHVSTTVTAANAIAQSLRGAIEAVTQTKNEMIRELQYTKEYIEDNPAGKNDDIAKSEGIKEAVATYNTYVGQVGTNVDSMLRQGSGHFQAMTAAAEVASLTGGSGGGGGQGGPSGPPRTGLDGVTGVNAPNTLQTGITMPGAQAPAPVDIQGFNPGGTVPGGLPGGGVPGMPGGSAGGPGGGPGGAPALQPFKMPTAQAPTPFSSTLGAGGRGLNTGGPGGGFGGGGTGGSSLGPDGKPSFKLPSVGAPGGLTLAGHQPPNTDGTPTGQLRPMTSLRPFTPGGSEPGGIGGIGGFPLGSRGGTGSTPLSPLTGRPGGLPGGTLPGRGTTSPFSPGGRAPGSITGSGGPGGSRGGSGLGGSGLGGGARVGGAGGGASALGGYNPGGGRSAGGLGGAGGAHPLGTPTTAGGVGGRGVGGAGGSGHGAGGGVGASGAGAASARGAAAGGMPGMPGMGAGAGAGAAKSGSRFVRPTRFGVEEDEEETVALRDAGILGQAVHHDPQDRHWQRMRQRWVEESGMAPAAEPVHTAVAGVGQEAPAGGGDLMSQFAAAVLGPEGASALNAPAASGDSGSGGDATATAAAAGTTSGGSGSSSTSEDAYLERARSVAERRGRTDEDAPTLEPATATTAPATPVDGPPPLREEEGFQVPSPFMRAALARLATSGGFPEGSGEAPAAGTGTPGAAAGQGR
ncbi:hypothetical protein ACIA8O_06455 [Kitasatospora sp. NPDC051853]|uniref:WXG100-like domain-containing protein n=1 Tax=Kitasatospora sp. NPDC051853 TaxID=3364058 RepID=UPI003793E8CB